LNVAEVSRVFDPTSTLTVLTKPGENRESRGFNSWVPAIAGARETSGHGSRKKLVQFPALEVIVGIEGRGLW
jgi:hypothetical protein